MEYTYPAIWLVLLIILVIAEGLTGQLISIWFAIAAAVVLILSLVPGITLNIQIIVFASLSIVLLLSTRPLIKRFLSVKEEKTNADSLVGKTATVTEEINNLQGKGLCYVNGQIWTARSSDESTVEKDAVVQIEDIHGVKLIVKKLN